jgi:glycosyltransferase involved in cell wall biosynthesis
MESAPLVSVVTPFYNTREYLAECIESVLKQTHSNWEYVLVNNRSTDGSEQIAQRYVHRFPEKICLVHTPSFLTRVQNYNLALAQISPHSKYCKMVQADDWIFPECLQSMVEVAEAHPKVAIVAAYELEGSWISLDGLPYPSPETPGREVGRLFFQKNVQLFGSPTSLMFRSDIVRQRNPGFYDERHAPFEDPHACFDILLNWNFGFVHQVLTFSRRDNESTLLRIRPYRFDLFSRLAKVLAQGRNYLSEDEYRYFLKDAQKAYFYFLGRSVLKGKDADFWRFHRESLASIDYSLNAILRKWIPLVLLDDIGNPKRTLEYLWPRRTRVFSAASRFLGALPRAFGKKRSSEQT